MISKQYQSMLSGKSVIRELSERATALKAEKLIFLTDIDGVRRVPDDPTTLFPILTIEQARALIADGTISGGMIPKVEACRKALLAGVSKVRMVNGKDQRSIVSDVMRDVPHGTVITK